MSFCMVLNSDFIYNFPFEKIMGRSHWSLFVSVPHCSQKSVYGVLRTVEGQQAFDDVMKHTRMRKWYQAMEKVIQERGGQD